MTLEVVGCRDERPGLGDSGRSLSTSNRLATMTLANVRNRRREKKHCWEKILGMADIGTMD